MQLMSAWITHKEKVGDICGVGSVEQTSREGDVHGDDGILRQTQHARGMSIAAMSKGATDTNATNVSGEDRLEAEYMTTYL